MPTNLHIDDRLLDQARRLGGHPTKRETVEEALRQYVQRCRRLEAVHAFGTVEFDPRWNYKLDRSRRDRHGDSIRETATPWPARKPRMPKKRRRVR
jgi:Arc/MetJ family transcription regulator